MMEIRLIANAFVIMFVWEAENVSTSLLGVPSKNIPKLQVLGSLENV